MAGFGRLEGIRGMLRFDLCFFFCVFLPGYVTFMYYYAVTILAVFMILAALLYF